MSKLTDLITTLVEPICVAEGVELWDVAFVKEGADWYLRVSIDSAAGITLDNCEKVSRALDTEIDRADPIEVQYYLEVSSAGLERQLKTAAHFLKFIGSMVRVTLYHASEGQREHIGKLLSYENGNIEVETEKGVLPFEKKAYAKVKLYVEF